MVLVMFCCLIIFWELIWGKICFKIFLFIFKIIFWLNFNLVILIKMLVICLYLLLFVILDDENLEKNLISFVMFNLVSFLFFFWRSWEVFLLMFEIFISSIIMNLFNLELGFLISFIVFLIVLILIEWFIMVMFCDKLISVFVVGFEIFFVLFKICISGGNKVEVWFDNFCIFLLVLESFCIIFIVVFFRFGEGDFRKNVKFFKFLFIVIMF